MEINEEKKSKTAHVKCCLKIGEPFSKDKDIFYDP